MNPAGGRPAAFVDRDGTLIREVGYAADPADVQLLPGAAAALLRLARAGYAIVIVSNQSGIARGYFSEADYRAVDHAVRQRLAAEGVRVDGSYHCPHHPDFTGPCDCRKPATGLFRRAASELELDLPRSAFFGDRLRDVQPARDLGGRALLVRTGYGDAEAAHAPSWVSVHTDLLAAAEALLAGPEPVDTPDKHP